MTYIQSRNYWRRQCECGILRAGFSRHCGTSGKAARLELASKVSRLAVRRQCGRVFRVTFSSSCQVAHKASRLGCWTFNPVVPGSSSTLLLTGLFLVSPSSTPWLHFVNNQLVCHLPVGIFNHFKFIIYLVYVLNKTTCIINSQIRDFILFSEGTVTNPAF